MHKNTDTVTVGVSFVDLCVECVEWKSELLCIWFPIKRDKETKTKTLLYSDAHPQKLGMKSTSSKIN